MKKVQFVFILASILLFSCSKNTSEQAAEPAIDTIPQIAMQIQKSSKLYTSEFQVHKIITHDDQLQLKGAFMKQDFTIDIPAGKRKIAIPIDATLKAYIDFSQFSEKNIHRDGTKITIILPDPTIVLTGTKVNNEEVKQYVALTRSNFSDEELTDYERQGRASIVNSIAELGIIETARASAAHTLIPMIEMMGFKDSDITIEFRKNFTINDINHLLKDISIEKQKK